MRVLATPNALDFHAPEPLEQMPDHVQAHTGTETLDVADGKKVWLGIDRGFNKCGLGAAWGFDLSGTLLEFSAAAPDNRKKEIEPRREIMFTLVPALGTAGDGRNARFEFDDFVIDTLELSSVAARRLAEGVELFEGMRRHG